MNKCMAGLSCTSCSLRVNRQYLSVPGSLCVIPQCCISRGAVQQTHRNVCIEWGVCQLCHVPVQLRVDCALPNLALNLRTADHHVRVQCDDSAQQEIVVLVQRCLVRVFVEQVIAVL